MDKDKYKKALDDIQEEIKDCSSEALDNDGTCICCLYPCWRIVAEEAVEKQLTVL